MSGPLATALTLLAGLTLYAALHGVFNIYYRSQRRMYAYFVLMCVFASFYIFTRLHILQSHNAENFIATQRLGFLAAQLFFLSQIGFITEYAQWWPRWLLTALIGSMLGMLILNLFLPYGLAESSLPKLQQFTLPWGEVVTDTRIRDKTIWWHLQWFVLISVFIFQFAAAIRLRKAGDIERGNSLLWFGGIFFAAMLFNLLINFYFLRFTQMAEFGFIAMIAMISLQLNRQARNTQLRAEFAEGTWSSLVMNAPNFILLIDPTGVIRFINHVLPGDANENIIGSHIDTYLPADSQANMRECLQKVASSKTPLSIQLHLEEPRNRWMDVQLAPLLIAGKLENIIVIATDISNQIALKHKLQQSEAKYRQLLQTLPYGVQEIDQQGIITFSNPAHDQLFGYEPGQMLGKSIFELPANEAEADKLRESINYIYATEPKPETYCKQDRRKNGEVFDIKIDWNYKRDEQGNVIGLISVMTDITQQVKAEQALRDSEEKFRQLAENINKVFFIRDLASNRMLYVSPAYEKIWGRSLEEIYNDPEDFITSIHPDDRPKVIQLLAQQNQAGQIFDAEYRIIDKKDVVHWVHARSYPVTDAQGKTQRVAGLVEDITQRKLTEQHLQTRTRELKETHDFTEAIVDTIGAVIIVLDKNGSIVRFNHACEYISGYSADEAIGHAVWEFLILPEERLAIKQVFANLTSGEFPNHYENYWLNKNGSKRLIAWSNTCLTDQVGNVEYVIGTGVDITEQRRIEAALRDSADKYRALMEHASDIILIADLDGKLIECNGSALLLLGYSREELLSLHVTDIHPSEQLERTKTDFQNLLDTGSMVSNDNAVLCRDGQVIPVDVNANIIEYQGRKVAVGFIRDIRARKQIEEARLQAERRQREMLVREVHHRIKNNLQGVIGLLRNSLSDDMGISKESERLIARAIAQIATIAIVHGLQSHFTHGEVMICNVTRAIVDQCRAYAPNDIHIEFHDNVIQPALLLETEAIPLALVINELLTNAIKHIPDTATNKQVIVELKGCPATGMDLLVFNSGTRLCKERKSVDCNQSGAGLDLIDALLPKAHTHFSLTDDPETGGVSARLRIEPAILREINLLAADHTTLPTT